MDVHFSSKTPEWSTPQDFYDQLQNEFKFDVDVCATKENAKVKPMFFTKEIDGLKQNWNNLNCWCNPPYGREIGKWVAKASEASGGDSCNVAPSSYRYTVVPYFYTKQSRDSFYKRQTKVWGLQKLSTLSFYGLYI